MTPDSDVVTSNKDKDAKKAAKQAAKDERKAEKEARKAKAAEAAKRAVVVVNDYETAQYGDLQMVQSASRSQRQWGNVRTLDASSAGKQIWIRCRLETVRSTGKRCFLVLRQTPYTIQAVVSEDAEIPREMVKYIGRIPVESIVDVFGVVLKAETPISSTSQSNVEIQVVKLFVISASAPVLAMQIADANRPIADDTDDQSASDGMATVGRAVRLDNRWLDLRAVANHSIFRLQSAVGTYFREFFLRRDFVEVHTPKLISAASEGGADVFKLDYFGNPAFLAQSPQLYKQMCINGDLHGVFEIGPVFRSERSFTHRHMCEFTGLDFEMEIKEHYHEVLETLGDLFKFIFDKLHELHSDELEIVRAQYPFEKLQYPDKPLVIHFADAIKLLREAGDTEADELTDISTPQEKHLGALVKEKYGTDFYIVDRYPMSARPFYTMPCPDDPLLSNSYDVFLRGEEITSGAQRIHDPELLQRRAEDLGVPVSTIQAYVDSFKSGAFPHGGAGIGLERVVMLFCGLKNIRLTSLFPRDPSRCSP